MGEKEQARVWEKKVNDAHNEWMEKVDIIIDDCWLRIAANGGFMDKEFVKECISDAINKVCELNQMLDDAELEPHADWCNLNLDCNCGVDNK